jgi:glycosyltransferase involved in cell wall biosynthesis
MKPKVLMFGWEFPPFNSGGLGTACFGLTRGLANEDINVVFVLPRKVDIDDSFVKIIFADTAKLKQGAERLFSGYITSNEYIATRKQTSGFYGNTLLEEVAHYAFKAGDIAIEENPDVIHAHDWLSFPAGLEAKKATGKPLILHVHATEFDRTGGQGVNTQVYDIEKDAMARADSIIAVSNFTKEKIVEHYGIPPEKVTVVHNGIDKSEYKILPPQLETIKQEGEQKIVLFVGRITIQKGPEYFVRAAKKVLEYYPNTLFVIAGSGDMQQQMMNEAAYLGLGDKMMFTGFLRGDDLNALYQAADLYVLPSVSEPFGITPLESIVNGTPVIVSKQSGVSEVLTHALKVDFWDTDEMANKILGVLQNNSLKSTLTKELQKEIKKLSWSISAKKIIDVYKKFFK